MEWYWRKEMTNKRRKGFTITELVIVIAVIAILSAVLIPTFAGVTNKANKSAADRPTGFARLLPV